MCSKGDIVHVKNDLSKHHARDFYLVTSVNYEEKNAEIQKFCGNQLKQKRYVVNLDEIYLASPHVHSDKIPNEEDEGITLYRDAEETKDNDIQTVSPSTDSSVQPVRSSSRIRKTSDWLATEELERC